MNVQLILILYDAEYQPGDNKWAASVLAMDPNNGKIKWGFQYTPNDPYDYDEISEHQIIDAKVNGESRKLVVHGARNGFYYALDRINGAFIAGKQYVDELNWTRGLDPRAFPEKNESGGIPLRARIGFKNRTGRQASMRWGSRIQRICVSG